MSRRSNRRTVKVKQTVQFSDSESSHSEESDDSSWLQLFAMAFQHSRRRRSRAAGSARRKSTPRKTPKKASASSRKSPRTLPSTNITVTVPLTSAVNNVSITTSINLDDSVIADQSKKVEDKVESFFKTHNLISDDEDEGESSSKKAKYPSKDTKEFYEIPDSDDDVLLPQPSTSHSNINRTNRSPSPVNNILSADLTNVKNDEVIDIIDNSTTHKEDELMDIVDKILESTDKTTDVICEKDESWTDYKNKAEEILGSISNLLGEISKDTQPKTVEPAPSKQESPKPVKPSCPICFEVFGGEVTAMTTTCGHIFCKTCINQVAKTVKKCPTCRKAVNQKKIHPIYL